MDNEQIIFEIIAHAGNARAKATEAIEEAKKGKFKKSYNALAEADDEIIKAHKIQNLIITQEVNGVKCDISLLLIHAEDHLMNSITTRDYAKEIIELYEKLFEMKNLQSK